MILLKTERVVGVGLTLVDCLYQELLGQKLEQLCEDSEHHLHDALFGRGSLPEATAAEHKATSRVFYSSGYEVI